ncbi:EAL domain-containing protein [Burkholderia sp. Ac-20345]|nr:EAL domain-containing protein [Burkholderia sp. Ac-20345]
MAGAVIALGRNLKLAAVALGVEQEEQCEYLREFGRDAVQGYLISLPMPANEVTQWLSIAEAACPQ